jgi:hypothetical protein
MPIKCLSSQASRLFIKHPTLLSTNGMVTTLQPQQMHLVTGLADGQGIEQGTSLREQLGLPYQNGLPTHHEAAAATR